jgi:hypothetical protein
MNTLRNVSIVCAAMLALVVVTAPARAVEDTVLPQISTLTAKVGKYIAAELKAQMLEALGAPRPARVRHSPTVLVAEDNVMVVVASRLPAEEPVHLAAADAPAKVRL